MNNPAHIPKPPQGPDWALVDRLVDIYLDGIVSVSNDAGKTGDSILARVIEFGGQPPAPSGNDQSNLAMIHAIGMLTPQHHHFPAMRAVVNRLIARKGQAPHLMAKLVKEGYTGLNQATQKAYTREDKAWEWYRLMLSMGLKTKQDEKNVLQDYDYGAYRAGPRLIWREWQYK